ncbi:hypothetical protein ACIA8O_22165 [Kitasatospora sp. NPDC051853]|uniref:hypothetical protein n=1 Tax=Kitasatospora sp. NPDC051853 TaxID=3364058 RepID=UPI0037AE0584
MGFVRTTPPRPVDVASVFPELAPLARAAVRLHPRPGSPSVADSSVGGPLLWPAGEPWPHCEAEHPGGSAFTWVGDLKLRRSRRARLEADPGGPECTPEERAAEERNAAVVAALEEADLDPSYEEPPVPMLPVAQLYLRDVPLLRPPGGADLLQLLWCPMEHEPLWAPSTALFWRSAAEVVDVLAAPPEPACADSEGYVPRPCLLAPELITEYPNFLELDEERRTLVADGGRWRAAGVVLGEEYEDDPDAFYNQRLAEAPGWKVGGWTPWGRTDPYARHCSVCETRMVPLLTIASFERDGEDDGWMPFEDQDAAYVPGDSPVQPTAIEVGSTDHLQLYVCPADAGHPHTGRIQ